MRGQHDSRLPVSAVDVLLLALPLVIAIVNPGRGVISGFYAAVAAGAYLGVKYGLRRSFDLIDWLGVAITALLLLSPLWAYDAALSGPASRGDAVTVAYFIVTRKVIADHRAFERFVRCLAAVTTAYAGYYLADARRYDTGTLRVAVTFSNANYTAAILAFGGAVAIWLAVRNGSGSSIAVRVAWIGAHVLHAIAIIHSGSRASLVGVVAADLVILVLASRWKLLFHGTRALLAIGFVIGFFPQIEPLLRWIAGILSGSGSGTFTRSPAAVQDLSGRAEIWASTRRVIAQGPILGSGPDGYRMRGTAHVLAHSWGLEYVASVGIIGALLIAAVFFLAFTGNPSRLRSGLPPHSSVWNSATALSLVPNLVLSTHQWTLWAWVAIALWSRSRVLDDAPGSPLQAPEATAPARRPPHS